jgi:hypothetical protein
MAAPDRSVMKGNVDEKALAALWHCDAPGPERDEGPAEQV